MSVPDPDRYIYLYAASEKQKQQYADLAEEAGVPLSKFLLSKIEEALAEKPPSRKNAQEMESMREMVAKLQEDVRQKDAELHQTKALLERQRNLDFLDDDVDVLELNQRLVDSLKEFGPMSESKLFESLGAKPLDLQMSRAISVQLEFLERHKKIKKGGRGWKWVG